MSQLNYQDNSFIEKLVRSHNPEMCPIRYEFIQQEFEYFRKKIRDSWVLVAGSGLGLDASELADYNVEVLGIDNNPLLIAISKAYIHKHNVRFALADFMDLYINSVYKHSILNFGTIGNFSELEQRKIIRELIGISPFVHIDFYTEENIENRIKMYIQEGWRNVKRVGNAIISDDGGHSQIFSKQEFDDLVRGSCEFIRNINYHTMLGFGYMAEIERK